MRFRRRRDRYLLELHKENKINVITKQFKYLILFNSIGTLLMIAYCVKLSYSDEHSAFIPLLTGLYPNFSQNLSDYLHSKSSIRLGIQPQLLNSRYSIFMQHRIDNI